MSLIVSDKIDIITCAVSHGKLDTVGLEILILKVKTPIFSISMYDLTSVALCLKLINFFTCLIVINP
jgi:hypothetical protein